MREGLAREPGVNPLPSEVGYELKGWTRLPGVRGDTSPGGVDLVADLDSGDRVLIEAKKDKPREAIWDAIKLADIIESRPSPRITAAYLIYDGRESVWQPSTEVAELFLQPLQEWSVHGLIAKWPRSWLLLLGGGRGIRPRHTVMGVEFGGLVDAKLDAYEGRILKILREGDSRHPRARAGM